MDKKHIPYGIYERFFKRLIDIVCSLLAIIFLSWILAIVAVLVRVKLGSPVLFKQARPGKNEKIFKLYKFRTMTDEKDENGELILYADQDTTAGADVWPDRRQSSFFSCIKRFLQRHC